MNDYGQRLAGVGLKLKLDCIGPDPVTDREQHYISSACLALSITPIADGDGGEEVTRMFSGSHESVGKDKDKESAAAEVAECIIRLGLIQFK